MSQRQHKKLRKLLKVMAGELSHSVYREQTTYGKMVRNHKGQPIMVQITNPILLDDCQKLRMKVMKKEFNSMTVLDKKPKK